MSNRKAGQLLAMMEALVGGDIQQKFRERTPPKPIKRNLNKICSGCGHKNKKCTCALDKAPQEKQ